MILNQFWLNDYQLFSKTKPILKLNLVEVNNTSQNIELECFQSGHMRIWKENTTLNYFSNEKTKIQKCLLLSFDYKYEVTRLWRNVSQNSSKGNIKTVRITMDESSDYLQLTGDHQSLQQLCQFLAKHINKIGFHQYFRVEKRIGKGNFASVFQVQRLEDGKWMAVKAFHKKTLYKEQFGKEGLINEINIMRKINHPNLMKLYEVYETEVSIYMCVELLQGGQLYDYCQFRKKFDQKSIFQIMEGLVSGIRYLHKNGIMHRDLKLENILFREKDNFNSVVIADFGLSTEVNNKPYIYSKCGTPGFIAPEIINLQQNSSAYEFQCDLFSLGIIFYTLITGQPAFKGRNYEELVKNNSKADIDFNHKKLKDIPPAQLQFLKQLLLKNPNNRITSEQALNHPYFNLIFDEILTLMLIDDDCHINEMIQKINFDYVKQNKFSSNETKENHEEYKLLQTDELMDEQNEICDSILKIFMRSPIITGSVKTVNYSPSKKRHPLRDELKIQLI